MRHILALTAVLAAYVLLCGCGTNGTFNPVFNGGNTGFTVSAGQSKTITDGQSTTFDITVSALGDFAGVVSLGLTGLPSDYSYNFNPPTVSPTRGPGLSTLSVYPNNNYSKQRSAHPTRSPGTFDLVISATSGGVTHTAHATLTINQQSGSPDFTISVSPAANTLISGGRCSYLVTLTSLNGFSSPVSVVTSGGPESMIASAFPSNVITPSAAGARFMVDIADSVSGEVGNYTLTFTGTSGQLTHNTTATLHIVGSGADWTMEGAPQQDTLASGAAPHTFNFSTFSSGVNGYHGTLAMSLAVPSILTSTGPTPPTQNLGQGSDQGTFTLKYQSGNQTQVVYVFLMGTGGGITKGLGFAITVTP